MAVTVTRIPLDAPGWMVRLPWGGLLRTAAGRQIDRFIAVPFTTHAGHAGGQWIPPLWMDRRDYLDTRKNPFFQHAEVACFVASKGGRDVGRIAAVHDRDWERVHGDKVGSFGFFDCVDDQEVADALFAEARAFLVAQGRTEMLGPLDLSTNYQAGLLIDSFDQPPCVQMPYNPPWYVRLIESAGFTRRKDLLQWYLASDTPIPEKVVRVAEKVSQRNNVTVRPMDLSRWDEEVTRVLDIYNDAWENNWGFVPVSEAEFRHIAADLKMVIQPELALMAEVDGEPIGFCIFVKDMNQALAGLGGKLFPLGALKLSWGLGAGKKVTQARLIVMGIKAGFRRRGADSILFVESHRAAKAIGLKGAEIGWTLEDNDMVNRAIEAMHGKKIKTYRVYGAAL